MSNAFPEPRSVYVHVPFCARRCGYCDFTIVAKRDDLAGDYLRALAIELEGLGESQGVDTIYIGGGTPTQLSVNELRQLMDLLRRWFVPADDCEFTVEANPHGFDDEKMDVLASAGVNRVSLGVQSFDAEMLTILERDHSAAEVFSVVKRLRNYFQNVSLDLIFGVPGQSLDLWRETLDTAIALEPQHVSAYGLTIEKGTSFWSRQRKGQLVLLPEELERALYGETMDRLAAAGYEHYETSSFARPGFRSRHNQVYWTGLPYFGFGPGAARYVNGTRETNHRSVFTWLKNVLAGSSPTHEVERLSDVERARESIVLSLRRQEGVSRVEFKSRTGFDLDELSGAAIAAHIQGGLLEDTGSAVRLTREGRFLLDSVAVDFLG